MDSTLEEAQSLNSRKSEESPDSKYFKTPQRLGNKSLGTSVKASVNLKTEELVKNLK